MPTKAYLINPFTNSVTTVNLDGTLDTIYRHMDCKTIDAVYLKATEALYIDDEGLFKAHDEQAFFALPGWYPGILAGKALWIGTTPDGEDASPTTNRDVVESLVAWIN